MGPRKGRVGHALHVDVHLEPEPKLPQSRVTARGGGWLCRPLLMQRAFVAAAQLRRARRAVALWGVGRCTVGGEQPLRGDGPRSNGIRGGPANAVSVAPAT